MESRRIVHSTTASAEKTHWRKILLWTFVLLLLASAGVIGVVYAITDLDRFPSGMKVGDWDIGGMKIEQVQTQLEERFNEMLMMQIIVESDVESIPNETFTLTQLGFKVRADELMHAIESLQQGTWWERFGQHRHMRGAEFSLSMEVDEDKLQEIIRAHWRDLTKEPVSAQRIITERDEVVFIPEINAYQVDTEQLLTDISRLTRMNAMPPLDPQPPIHIRLPVTVVKPPVTVESLKEEGILRKIAEFSTSYAGSGEGRIHNIEATASVVNGMILKPDEVFDYEAIVNKTEEQFGFKEAPVISNGRLVPGIGGGICQITSTLYNVLLRTDIEIVERRNHSLPVSYVPLGLDATYAGGWINFKFRNSTGSHLLIAAETIDEQLTIKFFGNMPEELTYELSSEIIETVAPPVKYMRNATLPDGVEQVVQKGKAGYIVDIYRKVYENGELLRTELVSRDTYRAQEELIAVGGPDERNEGGAGPEENIDGNNAGDGNNGNHNDAPVEDGVQANF